MGQKTRLTFSARIIRMKQDDSFRECGQKLGGHQNVHGKLLHSDRGIPLVNQSLELLKTKLMSAKATVTVAIILPPSS